MKAWQYKHFHRCSDCGEKRTCVESTCIGDGSLPPPEGYLETCDECVDRDRKLYAAILARVDHLNL